MADQTQVPMKNTVKHWNCCGRKPIVLIKNKSSLIFFSTLLVNLNNWVSLKIIIILKEAQLLKQENNHKLCVSQEDTTAKNRKNIKFAYWSIEQLPLYTKTRRLKSFPWNALVYGSIMAFYLNLEKLGKSERCVMSWVSMSRLPVWVGLMCLWLNL